MNFVREFSRIIVVSPAYAGGKVSGPMLFLLSVYSRICKRVGVVLAPFAALPV